MSKSGDEPMFKQINGSWSKHRVRYEDQIIELQNEKLNATRQKTPKKVTQDLINFETFKLVDLKKTELKLYDFLNVSGDLLPQFDLSLGFAGPRPRKGSERYLPSFDDLVSFVFDDETVDAWIFFNIANEPHLLPKVFYRPSIRMQ
jgi:hypothetical protein